MSTRNWSNVPVTFSREVSPSDGTVFDTDGKEVAILTPHVGSREDLELVIECRSSGYYTEMSMYGGPDHLGWPAESDEERTLIVAYLEGGPKERVELPKDVQEAVFDLYLDEINKVELDGRGDDDGPDPDMLREAHDEQRMRDAEFRGDERAC